MISFILSSIMLLVALPATAALNVFACEPEWASLAKEIDRVFSYQCAAIIIDHEIPVQSLDAKFRPHRET